MDTIADVVLSGAVAGDRFGYSVSATGDLNHDGYDDVIVSAPYNDSGGNDSGVAYIFFGGQNMDNTPDVTLAGGIIGDRFGYSISDAGDMNNDGYDDVIVGTFGNEGHAYLFFGGSNMDNVPDVTYTGGTLGDALGYSVSGAGDINNDGKDDILIGAWANKTNGNDLGRVFIYTMNTPIINANLTIGSSMVWKKEGYFNGTSSVGNFSMALNDYLGSATSSGIDAFGNAYVDVLLGVKAGSEGNIILSNLSIVYEYHATVPDFSYTLNNYLKDHKGEKDASGNIKVPLTIRAQSAGRVQLSNLTLPQDFAPTLLEELQTMEMDEDTANLTLIDLYHYFHDDVDSDSTLDFSVVSATNSAKVNLWITGKRYLSVDALTGGDNDNWTGTVEATIACFDRWGQMTESNQFTIMIKKVNDSPVIMSGQPLVAEPGDSYSYTIIAVDGDKDLLHYYLTKAPPGMTIKPLEGTIKWLPRARGTYGFNVSVDDGNATSERNFTITVPNRPPIVTSIPLVNATVAVPYEYNVTTADSNLDIIDFSLPEAPEGMNIQNGTGEISWTPQVAGDYNVSIRVSDNETEAFQNFTVRVAPPDQPPSNYTIAPSPGRPKQDSGWFSSLEMEITASAAMALVAIGIAFSVGTEAGKYRLTLLFMPLYTRLRKENVLDNETRGMIRGCITSEPGIHYKGIMRRLKLNNGTAAYHLMTLERDGFIHSMADGRLKRFFPAGMKPAKAPPVLTRLEKIIFETLREQEGMSEMDISRALDVPYPTISRHINKMAKIGVLRLEKHGLTVKSYIVNGIKQSGVEEDNIRDR
jgi:DNA-binding MarR family transcriptional regulator